MASKNIKGITIEINGDVTKLDKALSDVDKQLSTTQKNLKDVERLLKLDPKNVELLDQKQRLLSQAVEQTSKRYDTLKKTLDESTGSNVQAEKWAEAQRQFQSEITKTENALTRLLDEQKRMEGLKFAPDSAEMIDLQKQIDATREKSEDLRRQSAETFEELGRPISVDQYDALQRELVQAKHDMDEATKAAKDFENGTDEVNDAMGEADATGGALNAVLGKLGISMADLTMAGVVGLAVEAIKAFVEWTAEAVKGAAEYADNILTLSTNFGIATDKLQEYQYMAELVDTDVSAITGSIQKLTQTMRKARDGNEDAAQAFAFLNTNIYDTDGTLRDASDVFEEIVGKMSKLEDGTDRDTLAMTLFGKSAMELNSLMAAMADGSFKDLQREAHELGYILSEDELATLGAVDDSFQRLDKAMEMAKNRIAIELAPQILDLTGRLLDLIETVDWDTAGATISNILQTAINLIGPLIENLGDTANAILEIMNAASKAASAVSGLMGKLRGSTVGKVLSYGAPLRGLPFFASGGVVEPNSPMLAVVGDNRSEREVIAPESLVRGAVADALAANGGVGGNIIIAPEYNVSDDQIIRVLAPKLEAYWARRGKVL